MTLKIALLLVLFFRPVTYSQTAGRRMEMEITAYCGCESCCGNHSDGITASGYRLRQGDLIVAAPKAITFGDKIYIPGYGLATVQDRGGAIKDNRLDVYFHTHQEALNWGRQTLQVQIFGGENVCFTKRIK